MVHAPLLVPRYRRSRSRSHCWESHRRLHLCLEPCRSCQRVKVYRLNDDGKWDDKGTGHVTIDYLERNEGVGLIVLNEEDNGNLLVHRINGEDVYRRQEDTIIAWRDHENGTELALSFQEATGWSFIWEHICNVQRSIQLPRNDGIENGPHPSNHEAEHSGATHGKDEGFHGKGNDFR